MSYFLLEIRMNEAGEIELERAARRLKAAQTRLAEPAITTRTVMVGVNRDDGQLVCLIEATNLETVRRLVALALLPAGRIREITLVTGARPAGFAG